MERSWRQVSIGRVGFKSLNGVACALALSLGASGSAQTMAKTAVPDAQVEANVLKSLAGASDLADQPMTTTTVYGVVTLSGSVQTEAMRTEAETIVSRTAGVQKVVDEMTLAGEAAGAQSTQPAYAQGTNPTLQSDGTMAPATPGVQGQGVPQGQQDANNSQPQPNVGPGAPEYRQQYPGGYGPPANYGQDANNGAPQEGYPQQQQQGYPQQQQGYPQQQQGYGAPPPQGYPQQQGAVAPGYYNAPAYAGQQAGEVVTIPAGALVRMRINQTLDSARTKAGERFDGIVINDVAADGAVAIPRGAAVQGVVVDAKKSGALAGRGELALQLTQVTMGGRSYPIVSDVWAHNGADKTVQSVNSTVVGGGVGALVGAAAGGGAGAAIGAGVGGLLGLGAAASSHSGQVFVPSEGLLTFHLTQPATVSTVSQAEMDRLGQGVPGGAGQPIQRRYPAPGYGPVYRPYPYPY